MPRAHLVIVTRRDASLYAYLQRALAGVRAVEVIQDRRSPAPPPDGPPATERRSRADVAAQIRHCGYAVVARETGDAGA